MNKSENWHIKVETKLAELAAKRTVMTYLEMVEFADIPSPYRIHQLTEFLENLIRRDIQLGQPLRAGFVVSKTDNLPADGFFDCVAQNGIQARSDETRAAFHQRLING